jgi:hypothetical protein
MAVKKVAAAKKTSTAKKAPVTKKTSVAKKTSTAKKASTGKGAKTRKKPVVDEAIRYYLGPDGKIVKEVLEVYKPKRLSLCGIWAKKHPKGIIKILDMKAVMR